MPPTRQSGRAARPARDPEPERTARTGPNLMGPAELAAYLDVPIQTVYRWRARTPRDGPPGYRVGRHTRFRRDEVDQWLATRREASR